MPHIAITQFGETPDSRTASLYTINAEDGASVTLTDFGARIVSICVPDKSGRLRDVALGYDSIADYMDKGRYFGATIGRVANRVSNGAFTLSGREYALYKNDGANTLHGGLFGFDTKLFDVVCEKDGVTFTYVSPDGEEGFPGELMLGVNYSFKDGALRISYFAESTADTPLNLTNHAYFNLRGHDSGDILDHLLMIPSDAYTPVGAGLIPTGELRSVTGTPFDFLSPHAIGERIGASDEQLSLGKGYDHNFALGTAGDDEVCLAAHAVCPASGITLSVYTDMPGIQLYTANHLTGFVGKGGALYEKNAGFCLETQFFPDSLNNGAFKAPVIKAGEQFTSVTEYVFGAE